MLILIDQDGVLADFDRGFAHAWQAHTGEPALAAIQRRHFHIGDDYPEEQRAQITALLQAPGFYRQLPLLPGAQAAIADLRGRGHDVWICTSDTGTQPQILLDKLDWISAHFGADLRRRTIISSDKTLIHGDWLIDDRPDIQGLCRPSWRHLLYDQAYNRHLDTDRIDWSSTGYARLLTLIGDAST